MTLPNRRKSHSIVGCIAVLVLCVASMADSHHHAFAANPPPPNISSKGIDLYNEAVDLNKSNQPQAAVDKLNEAIRLEPAFAEAYFNCATILMGMDREAESLPLLQKAISIKPDFWEACLQLGACYHKSGNPKAASAAYRDYLKKRPDAPDAAFYKSQIQALDSEAASAPVKVSADSPDYLAETVQNGFFRWPPEAMPLKVFIKDGSSVQHYRKELDSLLKQCFADWAEGSEGHVSFAYIDSPDSADIVCAWTNDPKELATAVEGGHARTMVLKHKIQHVDIALLTAESSGGPRSDVLIRSVALHEIGHGLGLSGHSSSSKDIMFNAPGESAAHSSLSSRDRKTLAALYSNDEALLASKVVIKERVAHGDPSSPLVRAMTLNSEGLKAYDKKNFKLARQKFEEALSLNPNDQAVKGNLGLVFRMEAFDAYNDQKTEEFDRLAKKAIELFETSKSKGNLITMLTEYADMLNKLHRPDEAAKVEARLAEVKGGG